MIKRPKPNVPAKLLASDVMPSIISPSPAKTKVKLSKGLISSLLYFAAMCACAMAIPTALERPAPKGPVVVSTPSVSPYSG